MEQHSIILEGDTRLAVPGASITGAVPPKGPAFFNPRARLNRDLSLAAYGAFAARSACRDLFLDGLAGTGARGLRVANELGIDSAINDINPAAVRMARESARINHIAHAQFSELEACRFFSEHSGRGERGSMVDVDPFGSPVTFLDCALRATIHGGMLSCTATDLQVLNGLFDGACKRKYGGVPARTKYGNEIAIRLILGCLGTVAGRLGMEVHPLFVESDMHYYRVYVMVSKRPGRHVPGFITHCNGCGHRSTCDNVEPECAECGRNTRVAGPLWTGGMYDVEFVQGMLEAARGLEVDGRCERILARAASEAGMPAAYYTLDEIAGALRLSPPRLDKMVQGLQDAGFASSCTSLCPTGFRTDATASEIKGVFSRLAHIS